MPREKKQHLRRRPDGRFACRYMDQWFYGDTEEAALSAREEYVPYLLMSISCKHDQVADQ